jgi:predicted ATP-grasp superfamily ATP-dependent carboligase
MSRTRHEGRSPCVLVLWVGRRPGPWTCRSLSCGGYRVLAAHPEGAPLGRSRYAPRPLRYPSPADRPDEFLAFVSDACRRHGVDAVLPLDEDIVKLLAERPPDLADARISGPDLRQYEALCDKARLGETAAAAGVGRPRWADLDEAERAGWPPLPSVVKPRASSSWGEGASPPTVVRTEEERAEAIRSLDGGGAVVEELIEGPQWTVHCACGPGLFVGAVARVARTYPRGVGTPSIFDVGAPGGAPALAAAQRLLEHVGYVGIANAQFFERRGEMLVHDVNLRPPAGLGFVIRAGLDLPRIAVDATLGRVEPVVPATGRRFVYIAADRELAALLNRGADESVSEIALTLARAIASPRQVLDPSLLDLPWTASVVARGLRIAGRSAGRRAGGVPRLLPPRAVLPFRRP